MLEPRVSRPYWPDALTKPPEDMSSLKPWSWAVERLEQSHNYWIASSRPDHRPHLMIVWGIWLGGSLNQAAAANLVTLAFILPVVVLYWTLGRERRPEAQL